MTLRTRIAAAAGVAVALAVAAAALAVYLGVRGELRGEVDDSLRMRAETITERGFGGPGGPGDRGGPGAPRFDGPGEPFRQIPFDAPAEPFGGAEGFVQVVLPNGRALRFRDESESLPVGGRAREIAREGSGEDLTDNDVDGTHLRVLTTALPGGGAIQVARPLDEIDRQLDKIVLVLLVVGAGRCGPGRSPRRRGGPNRAGADRPLHPAHRGAGRRSRPCRADGGGGP